MRFNLCAALAALSVLAAGDALAQAQPQQQGPTREQRNLYFLFPYGDPLSVRSLNGKAIATGADKPVFTFVEQAARLNGFGGCNIVNADFRVGFGDLRFGPLNFTTKKCGGGIDATEIAIFKAIQATTSWKSVGHRTVQLSGSAGTLVLGPAF